MATKYKAFSIVYNAESSAKPYFAMDSGWYKKEIRATAKKYMRKESIKQAVIHYGNTLPGINEDTEKEEITI